MSKPVDITKHRPPHPIADSPLMTLIAEGVQHVGNILRAEIDAKIAALQDPRGVFVLAIMTGVNRVAEQVTRETGAKLAERDRRIAAIEERIAALEGRA